MEAVISKLSTDFKDLPPEVKNQVKKEIKQWLDDNPDWKNIVSV